MTRREALIVLNMLPNLGPVRLRRLLEVFPSPEKVLQATKNDLRDVQGLNTPVIESLARWESLVDLPRELAKIREFGADILTLDDDLYPPLLKEIHDPPTILYVWGTLDKKD
ncbi:MAG: DNA-protecting protein DprA, partial [Verrucomicrobia bacterium]|nr:DNA-protecting protein DprA [Verrucomicrobiota bacterium]